MNVFLCKRSKVYICVQIGYLRQRNITMLLLNTNINKNMSPNERFLDYGWKT